MKSTVLTDHVINLLIECICMSKYNDRAYAVKELNEYKYVNLKNATKDRCINNIIYDDFVIFSNMRHVQKRKRVLFYE